MMMQDYGMFNGFWGAERWEMLLAELRNR